MRDSFNYGDPVYRLEHLDAGLLDCAILPLPVDANHYAVQPISHSPLAVCMRGDDPLAARGQLDIRDVASRVTVFRDPEQYSSAHARLIEMLTEAGVKLQIGCSARNPAEINGKGAMPPGVHRSTSCSGTGSRN